MPDYRYTTKPAYATSDEAAENYRQLKGYDSVERVHEPELAEQVFVCTRKYVPEVLPKVTDAAVKSALCASTTGQWAVEELPGKEPAREVRTKEEWGEWLTQFATALSYASMIATRLAEAGATIPAD